MRGIPSSSVCGSLLGYSKYRAGLVGESKPLCPCLPAICMSALLKRDSIWDLLSCRGLNSVTITDMPSTTVRGFAVLKKRP